MTRKTGNLGFGSRRTTYSDMLEKDDAGFDFSSAKQNQSAREIRITVDSIENIDESKIKEIMVRIEHMGKILQQSSQLPVGSGSTEVGLSALISTPNVTAQFLDDILSNPIFLTILDCTRPTSGASIPNHTPNIESKKKASKASNSPPPVTKSLSFNVLGTCNLDIGSFTMGEKLIRRTLLVEPEVKDMPFEIKTWVKYPRLSIAVSTGDTALVSESSKKFNNAIGITIESIYNVPEYIANGTIFEASLPVPSVGDKTAKIRFPNGVTVLKDNLAYRKKWLALSHLEDPGARTAHRISRNYCDVYSSLPPEIDIESEIENSRRVIRWNTWKNCHMIKDDINYLFTKLMRHRLWPIEISSSPKSKEFLVHKNSKSERKSKQAPSTSSVHPDHFLAFLDLSPFLYPGVTKVRVAAQLLTYSQTELINRFGVEFISEFGFSSYSQHSIMGNKRKSSAVRSKSSVRELEFESSGILVYNDESPTFILVEVELYKPFIAKRSLENLETDLRKYLCLKERMIPKKTTFDMMKQNFSQSLAAAVAILCEEYYKYQKEFGNKESEAVDPTLDFQNHLLLQEKFHRMKATLERAIVDLVKEKFGSVSHYEEKIPEIYVYLVTEMHKVTNQCLLGNKELSTRAFYVDNLQLYAEEAFEEGDFELAKRYLLLKLTRNTSNADYWLDCAVFNIKLKDYEDAIEAVREALALDFSHQIGLLMYGLLMAKYSYISIAEVTFDVLLSKYPNFIEGWVALSLVHSVFSNFEGSRVALQEAIKMDYERHGEMETKQNDSEQDEFVNKVHSCINKYGSDVKYGLGSFKKGISCEEPLSWTITFGQHENIFIRSTILLLKLGFYEYAALCLAEELLTGSKNGKPSPQFIYYTSVNYYLQGRYEEAIPILQKTVKEFGKDCFLWSLMGHCFYKLENHAEAISCYEYVKEAFNRPNDIHLVYSRMGFYYLEVNKFSCAKQSFVVACKFSPSPKLWKGVGMACLELGEGEEAEIAFSEANYLDNTDPETWAYLALTNSFLRRIDLFRQCYIEAKKRKLDNTSLEEKIKSCIALNGLELKEF